MHTGHNTAYSCHFNPSANHSRQIASAAAVTRARRRAIAHAPRRMRSVSFAHSRTQNFSVCTRPFVYMAVLIGGNLFEFRKFEIIAAISEVPVVLYS